MARPGDIFKKPGVAAYTIKSGLAPWAEKKRGQLYDETKAQRGYQETALGQLAAQALRKGPSIAGQQADLLQQGGQRQISQQLGTAGGGAQAARQAIIGTGGAGSKMAGQSMAAAARERLGGLQAYAGGTGQVIGGRTGLEGLARGYGQMGQLDKFRAQEMAAREKERVFQRQLAALGLSQQKYKSDVDFAMGILGGAAGVAQMYGGYKGPPKPQGGGFRYEDPGGATPVGPGFGSVPGGDSGAVQQGANLGSGYY
ncbi:hypothetical protein CMI37_37720 [Candidatus Pacearchaeota archaeon]|nr:hypothetical protein [Candidatus Pacearchaeota archaeon]